MNERFLDEVVLVSDDQIRAASAGEADERSGIFLTAYRLPSSLLVAETTTPKPPRPRVAISSKSCA